MEYLTGVREQKTVQIADVLTGKMEGKLVRMCGAVHTIRDMGEVSFLILRKSEGLVQCVLEKRNFERGSEPACFGEDCLADENLKKRVLEREDGDWDCKGIQEESAVEVEGIVVCEKRAPHGFEIRIRRVWVLSVPSERLPLPVAKWKLNTSLEAKLNHRPIALRNLRERAVFRIQEGIVRGFRDFLYSQGFTEIHTPKIGAKSAEGGANIFKLEYFHRPAILQQSPQFYKQMMVGVFDRVFETGPVFRAEKHNTKRHLNEYTSLDFEMGYIDGFMDIMAMETGVLQYMMRLLETDYREELRVLGISLPSVERIPQIRFDEAKRCVSEKYQRPIRNPYDLEPEEEALIGQYVQEEYGADFVFVTHYPSKKRPFYAMDDPEDRTFTLSFDLLYKGLEVTTGGQRIHDYSMLMKKMTERGMGTEGMEQYLSCFQCGMPPHGGLGIGLERLTMQLIGEENVREACLFPRDLGRLEP